MSSVTLDRVTIAYESDVVVHGLDLSISSGEWMTLIGPNGAGKTSILRAVAGLIAFTGHIRLGEHRASELGTRDLARRVAMLVQEPQMPEGMTVSQYVLLGRNPHLSYFARESRRDRHIVAGVLERLSLDGLAARPLGHLSGGERQRAAIARALAQQAPILLVDEPTSSLDIGRQQDVLELIDVLRKEQELTVIAAMHDLTLAGQYADRLAMLVAGRLVALGPAAQVITEPAIADHYHAHVKVLQLNGYGRAVVPIRAPATGTTEEASP